MAGKFTLGKEQRLKSRKLIERIFREGRSFSVFPFRVTYILAETQAPDASDAGPGSSAGGIQPSGVASGPALAHRPAVRPVQAGFGASRRNFKKAVDRNRIKRLTREAYRLQQQPLTDMIAQEGKTLYVFFIYTGKELPEYKVVMQKIAVILQKLYKDLGA